MNVMVEHTFSSFGQHDVESPFLIQSLIHMTQVPFSSIRLPASTRHEVRNPWRTLGLPSQTSCHFCYLLIILVSNLDVSYPILFSTSYRVIQYRRKNRSKLHCMGPIQFWSTMLDGSYSSLSQPV